MKWVFYLLVALCISGCGFAEREKALQMKETKLAQKEQELLLKENALLLKEDSFKRRKVNDTARQDTAILYNPVITGQWKVQMTCTETTCNGSAVGDTKSEIWDISYKSNSVIAAVTSAKQLVRIYTGTYSNNLLELTDEVDLSSSSPATKISVRLTLLSDNAMEGQREIIRSGDCKIVYAVQLNKQ